MVSQVIRLQIKENKDYKEGKGCKVIEILRFTKSRIICRKQ